MRSLSRLSRAAVLPQTWCRRRRLPPIRIRVRVRVKVKVKVKVRVRVRVRVRVIIVFLVQIREVLHVVVFIRS